MSWGRLVAKIAHEAITTRIRHIEVVYPHGDDKLPWVVVATSNGVVQVYDLADVKLDPLAPEEANEGVTPVASTMILSKPRLTSLSVCVVPADGMVEEKPVKKAKKVKKTDASTKPVSAAAAAAAPRVVVEMADEPSGDQQTQSKRQKKNAKKRKGNGVVGDGVEAMKPKKTKP
jgi:protein MAK11